MSVIEFKTNAWKSNEAAKKYHEATTIESQKLFQIIRRDLYLKQLFKFTLPGQKILDLGCGSGLIAAALYDSGYTVVGCDVSEGMLSLLRATHEPRKIETRKRTDLTIPAADGEFDAVISRMFIQHFPNWAEILREKARATKVGGIVFFDFGNQEHLDLATGYDDPALKFPYSSDPSDVKRYYATCTSAEMEKIASEVDLELLQIIPQGLLLLNAQYWKQSEATETEEFYKRLHRYLLKPEVAEFLAFIEEDFVSKLPVHTTYGNIVVLRKKAPPSA